VVRHLILKNQQSPGDIVMMTAALKALHVTYPGQYKTKVVTSCTELFRGSPYIDWDSSCFYGNWEEIQLEYPLIHESNTRPLHFIHGMTRDLGKKLGVPLEPVEFKGDVYVSEEEKKPCHRFTLPVWLIVSGGKRDYTAKWWDPVRYQSVVDRFRGQIQFVQVGEAGHHHPKLNGVLDLVGRTGVRDLVRWTYHARGVLSPVTFLMHLAAAVPVPEAAPPRACVVVAGGREPSHWEAYPGHQYIHTIGALPCCATGGCWKARVKALGDGDSKDQSLCLRPVGGLPECMDMITAGDVIRRIEWYL
jgi:ADP-heptose:LPS heptosyltransferase